LKRQNLTFRQVRI